MADPMFTMCGQVANVFVQPGGTSKKTGEAFDPRDKVQILGTIPLAEGGQKLELVTLNVEDATIFQGLVNKVVRVPVGFYAVGKSVGYYIPRGMRPQVSQTPSA